MTRVSATRLAFAILGIAFFAAPIAAGVVGVTAESFENRRLAAAPSLGQGWSFFPQASRYLVDRMPLRAQAVRANTRVWTDVFDADPRYAAVGSDDRALPFVGVPRDVDDAVTGDPAGAVARPAAAATGRAGWFYLDIEFALACDTRSDRATLARWGKIVRTIRASGRPAVVIVPPAKASVYPEFLPDEYPNDHCALAGKERFWRLLATEGPKLGVVELRSELVRLKEHAGDALFQRKDSHWSTLGAFTLVKAVLDAVGDGVRMRPEEIVRRGKVSYQGDLTLLAGKPESDSGMEYGIERAPDAQRVPGRTLLICDSFACKWLRVIRPYFEDLRTMVIGPQDGFDVVEGIRRADRVIFESMEFLWKGENSKEIRDGLYWSEPL